MRHSVRPLVHLVAPIDAACALYMSWQNGTKMPVLRGILVLHGTADVLMKAPGSSWCRARYAEGEVHVFEADSGCHVEHQVSLQCAQQWAVVDTCIGWLAMFMWCAVVLDAPARDRRGTFKVTPCTAHSS